MLLIALLVVLVVWLPAFDPLSGVSMADRFALCDCPQGDTNWVNDTAACQIELEQVKDALTLGSAITAETNRGVGGWWAANVYTGLLEKLGVIKDDETSKCQVVNKRTLKNAWCILKRKGIDLQCIDLVYVGRTGKHAWTGLAKKGTYPRPEQETMRGVASPTCKELPLLHHDIWTTLDPLQEKVTTEIPRRYAFVDIATFSERGLNEYCEATALHYRSTPTAKSKRLYQDIFADFLAREAEYLAQGER